MTESALDRILADDYLAGIEERPMPELRVLRAECDEVETELSYLRRLLQGRIDIVRDELARRREGGHSQAADLIARLPTILSDEPSAQPRRLTLPRLLAPAARRRVGEEVEAALSEATLARLPGATDDELEAVVNRLGALERDVSVKRRRLHGRIDAIQAEMARRYRTGEADVDTLLAEQ